MAKKSEELTAEEISALENKKTTTKSGEIKNSRRNYKVA